MLSCLFRSRNRNRNRNRNRGLEDRFHHIDNVQQNTHQKAAGNSVTSTFQPSTSSFNSNMNIYSPIAYPYSIHQDETPDFKVDIGNNVNKTGNQKIGNIKLGNICTRSSSLPSQLPQSEPFCYPTEQGGILEGRNIYTSSSLPSTSFPYSRFSLNSGNNSNDGGIQEVGDIEVGDIIREVT